MKLHMNLRSFRHFTNLRTAVHKKRVMPRSIDNFKENFVPGATRFPVHRALLSAA